MVKDEEEDICPFCGEEDRYCRGYCQYLEDLEEENND